MSLKFVHWGPHNSKLPIVQAMAWLVRIMIAIVYFINSWRPSDVYVRQWIKPSLVQIIACSLSPTGHYIHENSNIFIQENAIEKNLL